MKILKNKYLITGLAFFAWIFFFDSNNLLHQYRMHQKYQELQEERNYYAREIDRIEQSMEELNSDADALEKFAREKYLLKKRGEDLYLLDEE